jgi:hypothetical protein
MGIGKLSQPGFWGFNPQPFRNRPDCLIGLADSFDIEVQIPLWNLPSLCQQTIGESQLESLPFAHVVSAKDESYQQGYPDR